MTDPEVVPRGSLQGTRVAFSASESADLGRLGLSEYHCRLVIAELGRALMLTGATVVYGGNLSRDGYTDILIEEAQRFGGSRKLLELVLPETEYRNHTEQQLRRIDERLGEHGRLVLIRSDTVQISLSETGASSGDALDSAQALTAMRSYVSRTCDARVILGGRLKNYQGAMPGIIEEALLTVQAGKVLLVAGGYGGAASLVSSALTPGLNDQWRPSNFPVDADNANIRGALQGFASVQPNLGPVGKTADSLRRILAASHRPADISTCVVRLHSLHAG